MIRVVGDVLRKHAVEHGDIEFIKCDGVGYLTYAEVDRRADRVAAGLSALGVKKGDRVAIIMPNRIEMIDLFFGCARLGAVQVPLNYYLRGKFLEYQLRDCAPTAIIGDALGLASARPLLDRTDVSLVVSVDQTDDNRPGDVAFAEVASATGAVDMEIGRRDLMSIIYTSGTTGMPKGCMLSHGYYTWCGSAFGKVGWVVPGDRMFTALPMFHLGGRAAALMAALMNDASINFEGDFRASSYMARAASERATMIYGGVPAAALAILAQPPTPEEASYSFRLAQFTALTPTAQEEFERRFKTPVMVEGYGQTEVTPATINRVDGVRKRGGCGPAAHGREVRILDENDNPVPTGEVGQIAVRPTEPDSIFAGYWNKPEATLEAFRNFWHHTGDLGRMDEDGHVFYVDRASDSLRRRGENISSVELETAIREHPNVAMVAICAVPSDLGEDDVMACVVLDPPNSATVEELFEYFKRELPYYAIPRYLQLRECLPVNVMGRILKHELRSQGLTADTIDLEARGLVVSRAERRG